MASPLDLRLTVPVDQARYLAGTDLTAQGFTVEPTERGLTVIRGDMTSTVLVGAASGDSMHVRFDLIATATPTGSLLEVDQSGMTQFLKGGAIGAAKARDVVQNAMHRLGTSLAEQGVLDGPVPAAVGYADRTNIVAIFALVLGFIVPVGGIIAGIVALGQTKRTGEKGRGLAIAGIAVGSALTVVITVVAIILIVAFAAFTARTESAIELDPVPGPGSQSEAPLPSEEPDAGAAPIIGDCIDDSGVGLEFADCTESHDYEVFTVIPASGDAFPGDDALTQQAETECVAAFPAFAGIAFEESALGVNYIAPTEDLWAQGDRQISCLIYDPVGPVTGSLANAAR